MIFKIEVMRFAEDHNLWFRFVILEGTEKNGFKVDFVVSDVVEVDDDPKLTTVHLLAKLRKTSIFAMEDDVEVVLPNAKAFPGFERRKTLKARLAYAMAFLRKEEIEDRVIDDRSV